MPFPPSWPVPRFAYGAHVFIVPLERVPARVVDLYFFGSVGSIQYEVRYFHEGKEQKIRVFEDELSEGTLQDQHRLREGFANLARSL